MKFKLSMLRRSFDSKTDYKNILKLQEVGFTFTGNGRFICPTPPEIYVEIETIEDLLILQRKIDEDLILENGGQEISIFNDYA